MSLKGELRYRALAGTIASSSQNDSAFDLLLPFNFPEKLWEIEKGLFRIFIIHLGSPNVKAESDQWRRQSVASWIMNSGGSDDQRSEGFEKRLKKVINDFLKDNK